MNTRTSVLLALLPMLIVAGCDGKSTDVVSAEVASEAAELDAAGLKPDVVAILEQARRVPNSTSWFEILELPNNVYAFWEPGHVERVNSFLIVGSERDVLYDTGMGIASLGQAVADLRQAEGLPEHELMVINSHNHLDHNGGNGDFERAYIIEDEWAIRKLTEGLTGSAAAGFVAYWSELAEGSGVEPPEGFDPETFEVPPYPRDRISFLADGDIVDLGDRRFRVIHTTSHSPDGLALYDEDNKVLFGGDTYLGDSFLIRDLTLLQEDLVRASDLAIEWHYCSHGPQLIEVMRSSFHLSIVRRMMAGEREEGETVFAGQTFPLFELEGVAVTLAGDFLTY